ncbi:MAG TPA: excinuclease ABC subunit UvrC [Candidatus Limnocylindria bacterium]|jgi:excinuclease ABC subunit C|nr:excinuclease ABC subunit UvrC [Candidatus Limnocylindria bacterium]
MNKDERRESLEAQVASFPDAPGVYQFKDPRGRVLYVGKADVLRDRVRAYFGPSLDVRHVRMVERAERVEFAVTGSISEAYLLEASLIKQHKPRYNIRLKDDKSYPYVKITLGEDFPRILRTRSLGDRTARYFGPFANAKSVDQSLDLLQKLFPYRTCKLTILADDEGRGRTVPPSALPGGRPCLLFHLKRCTAPCVGNTTKGEYRATIDKSVLFLEGRYETLARATRKEMESAAETLEFERAATLRDRLTAIDRTLDRQEVHAYKGDDFDVLAAAIAEGDSVVQLFRVRDGTIVGRDHFALEGSEGADAQEVIASFLRQHYSAATMLPPEIVTPAPLPEGASLEAFLTERRGGPVRLHVPQRGKKRHLAELAERNAKDALEQERVRWLADRGKTEVALRELQEALGLEGPPKRIECYDVSHVQGTSVVSSMVVFEDGRPAKSQYRRFRARISDRNDDFANMRETLKRRFARAFVGGAAGDGEAVAGRTNWPLPDLIILDGGKGQLSAGLAALADAGRLQIPIAALAKEREELFVPNRPDPIVLPRTAQSLYLVQRIRDEAHRFAVTYHQKVRSRRAVRSILDDIAGVGPARKRALLRKFGSVRAMQEAPVAELAAVGGVGAALAERIKQALVS